jgi:N-acetylneuraminate synthase
MTERVFVIAEAGVNHNGDLETALQLVDVAADAGADAVKFQTFRADRLATIRAAKAQYQVANMKEEGSQLEMLRRLELSAAHHEALLERCRIRRIQFMSTAFDSESLAYLATLGMPAVKIPSGDITAGPLLLQAARLRSQIILSSGMSTLAELEAALGVLAFGLTQDHVPSGRNELEAAYRSEAGQSVLRSYVTLLHCVTQYPAAPASVNLRAMDTMASAFGLRVGYSDHTLGTEVALAAVARGASVIEKHFTLSRGMPGPDHAASLEPAELKCLVLGIRNIEVALGSPMKAPSDTELPNRPLARRSLVAARPIRGGEALTTDNLIAKRPGDGLSPMEFWDLLGRPAARDFAINEPIER